MRCHRCQGRMVNEKYYGAGLPFWWGRCVCCGEILDRVSWKNRNHRREPPLVASPGTSAERKMTTPKIGEILKYLRTGGLFEVKMITNDFVILSARDGSSQIMTGKVGFDSVFAKVPSIESPRRDLNSGSTYPVPPSSLAV